MSRPYIASKITKDFPLLLSIWIQYRGSNVLAFESRHLCDFQT